MGGSDTAVKNVHQAAVDVHRSGCTEHKRRALPRPALARPHARSATSTVGDICRRRNGGDWHTGRSEPEKPVARNSNKIESRTAQQVRHFPK